MIKTAMNEIGIIGGGAMGSIFAYFLQKNNMAPVIYEKEPRLAQVLSEGIMVTAGSTSETIAFQAGSDPGILADCDTIMVFVKSYATADAMSDITPVIKNTAVIVSLQNGLGNREIIEEHAAPERIVYGSTSIGAYRSAHHALILGGMGETIIGGKSGEAVEGAAALLRGAGIQVTVTPDPELTVWRKAVINAGINPLGALFGIENGKVIENCFCRELQQFLVREAVTVANAMGIALDETGMLKTTEEVCGKTAENRCSMLQDLAAHRQTEIDSINGAICNYGEKTGIATPVNRTIYQCIKCRETM
ncbi:MAG TPA: 2-dehydropantoate 2-reductase [Spirochaetota bacterium]|nr:2-dehydropantoate 2-reductase [Spirochaetota bacterium]